MAQAVMSNYFIVPHVTINTIIWKNWDLFSMRKYIWTVVRSRPDCVKMFLLDGRCFLCRPYDKEKDKYIADFLSKWGRKETLLLSGSLEDALNKCEDHIDDLVAKGTDLFLYLVQNRPVIPFCDVSNLNQIGISTEYIKATNDITNKMPVKNNHNDYTSSLFDQLTNDAEPYSEDALCKLEIIKKKYESENIDLLSEGDVGILYKSISNTDKPGRKKNQQKANFNIETLI